MVRHWLQADGVTVADAGAPVQAVQEQATILPAGYGGDRGSER